MNEMNTDFISIDKYDLDGYSAFGGTPSVPYLSGTVVEDFPQSDKIKGTCKGANCEYRGTAGKFYGWNSYYRCPKCDQEMVVVG